MDWASSAVSREVLLRPSGPATLAAFGAQELEAEEFGFEVPTQRVYLLAALAANDEHLVVNRHVETLDEVHSQQHIVILRRVWQARHFQSIHASQGSLHIDAPLRSLDWDIDRDIQPYSELLGDECLTGHPYDLRCADRAQSNLLNHVAGDHCCLCPSIQQGSVASPASNIAAGD